MALQIMDPNRDLHTEIRSKIEAAIPDAKVEVSGGGGHFEIRVISSVFEGKSTLDKQRLVYSAITPLMSGDAAPLHAVDRLETLTPDAV